MNVKEVMVESRNIPIETLRSMCEGLQEVLKQRAGAEIPNRLEELCKALFEKYPEAKYIPLIAGGNYPYGVGVEMANNWRSVVCAVDEHFRAENPHFLEGCLGKEEFLDPENINAMTDPELDKELEQVWYLASMGKSNEDWKQYEEGHGDITLMNRILKHVILVY